jgi:V/A-type H+-transporting ATPase subunit F
MNKIGIIGDIDSILGFKSFGIEIFQADSGEEAIKMLHKLAKEEFSVIYIIEKLASKIPVEIAEYNDVYLPVVVPIPGNSGSNGFGLGNMKKWVEKAIGADILFREG